MVYRRYDATIESAFGYQCFYFRRSTVFRKIQYSDLRTMPYEIDQIARDRVIMNASGDQVHSSDLSWSIYCVSRFHVF